MTPPQDASFRSAEMILVRLYMATETRREVVMALGDLGSCQFCDLNEQVITSQRPFTPQIRRLHGVQQRLQYFFEQIEKTGIEAPKRYADPTTLPRSSPTEIDDLAERTEELKRHHLNSTTLRNSAEVPLLSDVEQDGVDLEVGTSLYAVSAGFVAGAISRHRVIVLERILWRTLRGNLYMEQSAISAASIDAAHEDFMERSVFFVVAQGKDNLAKVRKISESMGARVYDIRETHALRCAQINQANDSLDDIRSVLHSTKANLAAELDHISHLLPTWAALIEREKAVYAALNQFSFPRTGQIFFAEAWCPRNDLHLITSALQSAPQRRTSSTPVIIEIRSDNKPPTYVKTSKYTEGFQALVAAYGTATYQEINPTVPTIVTLPFLFAVMFGDLGHAIVMLLAALTIIYWEKPLARIRFEPFAILFYGRYILLAMAIFSIFSGLIYNEIFSKPITLFDSAWSFKSLKGWQKEGSAPATLNDHDYRYPIGVDWAWHRAENNILFSNSYKMKMSIILGWCHMTYSLCLALVNAMFFKKHIDIWGSFLPRMIFFQAIFGYLVICIVYKWSVDWLGTDVQPPSLLNMLIYMFLKPGDLDGRLYAGQEYVQVFLIILAFAQIPVLLFVDLMSMGLRYT
ncbi:vacuolar ATP synthase subunit [Purpureocillium lilacinum]|uniref:V-type proton ATPase subunit a n=1 Tax=Purpureocillium lilacinum TaxID=33203 RepID=A0A179FKI1_PURLI|nr:vacuolar ATP synthase subunit [Purpureocillium lilacinum]